MKSSYSSHSTSVCWKDGAIQCQCAGWPRMVTFTCYVKLKFPLLNTCSLVSISSSKLFCGSKAVLDSFSFPAIRKVVSMTQTFTPGSAAQPASRKRPAASIEASSTAAPPASKRSKPSADTSGGPSRSAAQPATLLEQVEQLGHYPKSCKRPVTDKERIENSLAQEISKQWSKLDDPTRAVLTRFQQHATLLQHVAQLSHYPRRFEKPANENELFENSLANACSALTALHGRSIR